MKKEDCKNKTALVTGASSGIGLSFCRELAARGCNLVMVSNQDTLDECARAIAAEFGVKTTPIWLDLTDADAVATLCRRIDEAGTEPDYLINNAGIFSFARICDTSEAKADVFIDLHVRAVTALSREFAIRFKKRGSGRILNMSSMSCWMPMPGIALYSATKAYIRVLSRALSYELDGTGVTVTVACPGGIATDLFGLTESLKKLAVRIGVLATPERFARKALDRMLRGRRQYINGLLNRISIVAVGCAPACLRRLPLKLLKK